MSSKNYSIIAHFYDAYSLRILIDYLKTSHDVGNFIFAKDYIMFKRSNAKGDKNVDEKSFKPAEIINEVILNPKELVFYEFNETEPKVVGVDIATFKASLIDIGKKDAIRISLLKNDDHFNIQKLDSNVDSNGIRVPLKRVEDEEFELDEYKREIKNPNFVTPLADFAKKCKPISSNCEFIYLHQYLKGLKMEKISTGIIGDRYYKFGIFEENTISNSSGVKIVVKGNTDESKIIEKIKIRSEYVKNLGKLNNMSQFTNIRFYFEDDIGCYGHLISHLVGI
jgi:hypothetical protein